MTTPTASVQVSVGGGAYTSGLVQAAATQTLNFRQNPASAGGANSYTWQLTDYPPALTLPTGWSSVNGVYTYVGATPPTVTLPAAGANAWGPIGVRLQLNGNPLQYTSAGVPNPAFNQFLTDETCLVWIPSFLGMVGLQLNASTQFDSFRAWIGQVMHDLRLLDSAVNQIASVVTTGGASTVGVASIVEVTGALGSAATINLPNLPGREVTIYNGTSGAFSLTVQPTGGSGITVAQGKRATGYVNNASAFVRVSPDT